MAKKPVTKKASSAVKKAKSTTGRKVVAMNKQPTKTEFLKEIAEAAEISLKQSRRVVEEIELIMQRCLNKKNGSGVFVLHGLAKFQVIHKPATKARKGNNPFTGEATIFKAKPARNIVKIRALKKLKDMV